MTRLCQFACVAAAAAVLTAPFVVSAQSGGNDAGSPAEERRSPLPNYFGKIAVSDEQREELHQIQEDYAAKIDALQQQIRGLIRERDAKMEAKLTPGQKLRLSELRAEARQRAAQRASSREGNGSAETPTEP